MRSDYDDGSGYGKPSDDKKYVPIPDPRRGDPVFIDVKPYKPMIGVVSGEYQDFLIVDIMKGSRYKQGKPQPIQKFFLQPHKVNRLIVNALAHGIPDDFGDTREFYLMTDKPERYQDNNHPDNQWSFDGPTKDFEDRPKTFADLFGKDDSPSPEQDELQKAKAALGVAPGGNQQTDDSYYKARNFLLGGMDRSAPPSTPSPLAKGKRPERSVPVSYGLGRKMRLGY